MPARRDRSVKVPPVARFTLAWQAPLFTPADVQRIVEQVCAAPGRLVAAEDVDFNAIAGRLNQAFHNAIVSHAMMERLWGQDPAWLRQVIRDVSRLLKTLGLTPEQCTAMAVPLPSDAALPAIYHFREVARGMPPSFWPPQELREMVADPPPAGSDPRATSDAAAAATPEAGADPPRDPGETALADTLLQLLPRILGLVLLLAHSAVATTPKRPIGASHDTFRRELFRALIGIHVILYGRGPRSRNKVSERAGPSILWARLILETARDRMPLAGGAAHPTDSAHAWCMSVLADLAGRGDDTMGSWLEEAWAQQRHAVERGD